MKIKIKLYTPCGNTAAETIYTSFLDAVRAWCTLSVKWSPVNPTIWAWFETRGDWVRLSDVNYFDPNTLTGPQIAEYISRLFIYDQPENAVLLNEVTAEYRAVYGGKAGKPAAFIAEARAVVALADPRRIYNYRDAVTGAIISGTAGQVVAFVSAHDARHMDKTKWGPMDSTDVEAWALLDVLYN